MRFIKGFFRFFLTFIGFGLVILGFSEFDFVAIGVGSVIAGYLYPNESSEITKAVEKFEE